MHIDNSPKALGVKHLLLTKSTLHIKRLLPAFNGHMAAHVERSFCEDFCEQMSVELVAYIASHESEVKVPATWWEHFKLTYFSSRMLKRWPVKFKKITCRVLLPDFPFKEDDLPRKVIPYIPR